MVRNKLGVILIKIICTTNESLYTTSKTNDTLHRG